MRAKDIAATNFVAFEELDLRLPKKISVFVGPNGSGKSSIIDAVKVALVGTARGVPRGDLTPLRTWGKEDAPFATEIGFEHGGGEGRLRRTATKLVAISEDGAKVSIAQKKIEAVFGNSRALDAVFDVWRATEMSSSERKRLVFDLAGVEVTEEKLREAGLEGDAVLAAALAGNWKKAETVATELKRSAKRALGEKVEDPGDPMIGELKASAIDGPLYSESVNALSEISDAIAEVDRRLGAHDERDRISRHSKAIVARYPDGGETLAGDLDAAEGRVREQEEYVAAIVEVVEKARAAFLEAGDRYRAAKNAEKVVGDGKPHDCPICALTHEAPPVPASELLSKEDEVGRLSIARDEAGSVLAQGEQSLEDEQGNLRGFTRSANGLSEENDALLRAKKILAGEETTEDPKQLTEKREKLVERKARGTAIVAEFDRWKERKDAFDQSRERRERLEDEAKTYERIEKLCRPDGLPSKLLVDVSAEVATPVELLSRDLFKRDPRIGFASVDENFDPFVVDRKDGTIHPLGTLNESAKWRVSLSYAYALAKLSGLRFLAIDEVSTLDAENRSALLDALVSIEEEFDQILLAAPLGDVTPSAAPADLPVGIYLVETWEDGRSFVRGAE